MSTSTLQKLGYSLLFASVLLSPQVLAKDRHIAGCVDEDGIITYTDTLCYTVNDVPSNDVLGLVVKDRAMMKAPSVYDPFPLIEDEPEPIVNSRLQSATDMAMSECTERFNGFFRRKHPNANLSQKVTFSNVVDQFENGTKISVSVTSRLEYFLNESKYISTVECTVQNIQNDTNWVVGFIEK